MARERGPPVDCLPELVNPYIRKALDTRMKKGIRITASVKYFIVGNIWSRPKEVVVRSVNDISFMKR
jgi:hypothetical protein